jgi:hypothetical protein
MHDSLIIAVLERGLSLCILYGTPERMEIVLLELSTNGIKSLQSRSMGGQTVSLKA